MSAHGPILGRIWNWLVGRQEPLRLRCTLTLVAFAAFVLFAAFQHLEVVLGLIDRDESSLLTAFNLGGSLLFYAAVRTRLSEGFGPDPALNVVQMVFAMCAISWSYAITGAARGAVIGIMILVILFAVFSLKRRTVWRLALLGFGMLASVMAWRAWQTPERYDPRVELIHFVFSAIVMGAAAVLAMQVGTMRARLARQRADLEKALELNRELATRDALTGLLNRRAAVEVLAREHPSVAREQGVLALALLDIDHFKRINDSHGHDTGDAVLRRFAQAASARLRAGDALARWGGEEFLLVMPGATLAVGQQVLGRLRAAVQQTEFDAPVGPGGVTFSAGLVQCAVDESHDAAVARADRALYRAKAAGRDRCECDPSQAAAVHAAEPRPA